MSRGIRSTAEGATPRLDEELARAHVEEARQERIAQRMAEARDWPDDVLGVMWYARPGWRGVIECVRWERAAARGVLA